MSQINVDLARFNMIEQQIRPWEVLDQKILDLLAATPREIFVPPEYTKLAFADTDIPLAHGQVMMAPKVEGRLLQALQVRSGDRVLEIGTGSGYLTACLAKLSGRVVSLEIFEDLSAAAQERLVDHAPAKVSARVADALAEDFSTNRQDVIAVTGSMPLYPHTLEQWLTVGGRMFVIVGAGSLMEALLVTRVGEHEWMRESLFETSLPPLLNAPQPQRFVF